MSAHVVRLGASLADRYARFMSLGFEPADREEAFAEYLDFAERLVQSGFTRDDLQNMINRRRARLIRELSEINRI